ncbi:MAG TPA: HAD family hydrolase [Acholeplasmataceae bacterium]|jgi:FMN phosphatase YigB (HAD superfamily)|nr:HAD family hydrolase [Acholeplasmataceae bacterium]
MYKAILFDLDGSLLPLDEKQFIKIYFGGVSKRFADKYDPQEFLDALWKGTLAMMNNDGSATNENVFWKTFKKYIQGDYQAIEKEFSDYYKTDFSAVKATCKPNPYSKKIIDYLKQKDIKLVLATNPLFPAVATLERIKWAGLTSSDFEVITTYEDNYYCKPNLNYYRDILNRINCHAEECLMVGNDVREDMVVGKLGMDTYLLTECLINSNQEDIEKFKFGKLEDFYRLLLIDF